MPLGFTGFPESRSTGLSVEHVSVMDSSPQFSLTSAYVPVPAPTEEGWPAFASFFNVRTPLPMVSNAPENVLSPVIVALP